nr:hypothetical protein [Paraburkholderia bannensis]
MSVGTNGVLLSGLTAGLSTNDAVNVGQLTSVVNALGGGASFSSSTGAVTGPTYTLTNANSITGQSGSQTTVGNAFSEVDAALGVMNSTGIKYFHTNSSLADSSATGVNSTAIGPVASASGANAIAIGNGANASVANSVALGNGATTTTAVGTASGVIGGTTYTYAGISPTGTVSVGSSGAERTITNVAAGRVAATSTDAVNGSQLYAADTQITANTSSITTLQGNVTTINGQITNMQGQLANAVLYDSSSHNSVTLGGTGATSAVALHNVANGTLSASSLDAVNRSPHQRSMRSPRRSTHPSEHACLPCP